MQERQILSGRVYAINDKRTFGHKSLITNKEKNGVVAHIPTTHAPKTRGSTNIPLKVNFDETDNRQAYILSKLQYTTVDKVGKFYPNLHPRDAQDKAVIRHIKKQ